MASWRESGRTAKEFATAHGLVPETLIWWKWRLKAGPREDGAASPGDLRLVHVQVEPEPASSVSPRAVTAATAAHEPSPSAPPAWEIVTARGHVLRVHRGIAATELCAVLAALGLGEER